MAFLHFQHFLRKKIIESKLIVFEKILKDIDKKKGTLKGEINEEINKAEIEISEFVSNAPEKINKIAAETSSDLIKQLIGVEVNNSSIAAIVEVISKKVREKYHEI